MNAPIPAKSNSNDAAFNMTVRTFLERKDSEGIKVLGELYAAIRDYVFGTVYKLLAKRNQYMQSREVEDIYEDAMVILWNNACVDDDDEKRIEATDASVRTYVVSICINLIKDATRKKGQEDKLTELSDLLYPDSPYDPEERAALNQRVLTAFQRLGPECQESLWMSMVDKASHREIQAELGYASEAVSRNRKKRCIEQFRRHFFNPST